MDPYHSPDGDGGPDRKRRRKVLSCMDCRRRKVQCDRALPVCGRCEKAGKLCSYEDDSSPQQVSSGQNLPFVSRPQSVTISKDVWDDMMARLLQQERIIGQLQAGSHISPATPATVSIATPHTHGASETPGASNDFAKEAILFRGKGFKSFYYGPTDARSAMTLVSVMRELLDIDETKSSISILDSLTVGSVHMNNATSIGYRFITSDDVLT